MAPSQQTAALIATRSIRPTTTKELLTTLLFHQCIQTGETAKSRVVGKKVRQDQGVIRIFGTLDTLTVLIKTSPTHCRSQLAHIQDIFSHVQHTQEEFQIQHGRLLHWFEQTSQHADLKNDWIQNLNWYEVFSAYQNDADKFISDFRVFSYDDYLTGIKKIVTWPIDYFLLGGDKALLDMLIESTSATNSNETIHNQIVFNPKAHITRQLSRDPEACHSIVFQIKADTGIRVYMEILYAMLQNQCLSFDVSVTHGTTSSTIRFEKTLSITDIPAHMERVWTTLLQLLEEIPTKDQFSRGLLRAQSNAADYCKDPETLCSYLVRQKGYVPDQEFFVRLEKFDHVNVADWMAFMKSLFAFDAQQVFEVVPEVYGQGASMELRLESLKKRLGLKNEPTNGFLADQYQFQTFSVEKNMDEIPIYAQEIPLGEQHCLMANVVPQETLAHLTIYFDGGRRFEHEKNAGLTQLLMMSVLNGSEEKKQIKKDLESFGVRIDIENSADFFGFHFLMAPALLTKMLPKIMDLLFISELAENDVNAQKLQLLKSQTIKSKDPFLDRLSFFTSRFLVFMVTDNPGWDIKTQCLILNMGRFYRRLANT
ncbi:MAG: insulinase family protein [Bdellovibrionota bacterium]